MMLVKTLMIPWQVMVEPRTTSKASKAQDSARNIPLLNSSREVGVDMTDNSNSTLDKVEAWGCCPFLHASATKHYTYVRIDASHLFYFSYHELCPLSHVLLYNLTLVLTAVFISIDRNQSWGPGVLGSWNP